jgi:hypothetical protein
MTKKGRVSILGHPFDSIYLRNTMYHLEEIFYIGCLNINTPGEQVFPQQQTEFHGYSNFETTVD